MRADPTDAALAILLAFLAAGSLSVLGGLGQAYLAAKDPFAQAYGRCAAAATEGAFSSCYQGELQVSPMWVSGPSFGVAALTLVIAMAVHLGLRRYRWISEGWNRVVRSQALWTYLFCAALLVLLAWALLMAFIFPEHPVGVGSGLLVALAAFLVTTRGLAKAGRLAEQGHAPSSPRGGA